MSFHSLYAWLSDSPGELKIAILFACMIIIFVIMPWAYKSLFSKKKLPKSKAGRYGYVYVISNEGSFGKGVFKVGMTRRENPMDRIHELSDASVPFPFTVHSFIRTGNAPSLEKMLHKDLEKYRVNRVNEKKEFFCVDEDKLKKIIKERVPYAEFRATKDSAEWKGSRRWNQKNRNFL